MSKMLSEIPTVAKVAMLLFAAIAFSPASVWAFWDRLMDKITMRFARVPAHALGQCEAVDLVDGVDKRCRRLGVKIEEYTGHHYRHRFVCTDHGYEPPYTPPVIS